MTILYSLIVTFISMLLEDCSQTIPYWWHNWLIMTRGLQQNERKYGFNLRRATRLGDYRQMRVSLRDVPTFNWRTSCGSEPETLAGTNKTNMLEIRLMTGRLEEMSVMEK